MNVTSFINILKRLWKRSRFARFSIIMIVGCLFRNHVLMKIYRKWNRFPNGPNGVPVAGLLIYGYIIGGESYHAEVLPKYGQIVSYPTAMQQVLLINDPNIARKIYSNPTTWNRFEPFLDGVANTITFLNGPEWQRRRKIIHSNLIATINSESITKGSITFLKDVLFPFLDDRSIIFDLRFFRPLTFNLVLFACCGKHIQSLDDSFFLQFDALATKFWRNFRTRLFTAWLIGNGTLYNVVFKRLFNLEQLGETLRKEMVALVQDYDQQRNANAEQNNSKRKCFVDYVREEKILSEEEMFSDIASLLFPSIDTTSNTLGFCILLLCKYPKKVQNFIYEKELKPVFGGNVDNIRLSQDILSKLPYFRAFIFEAMRIYPTATVSAPHFLDNHDKNKPVQPIKIETENGMYQINQNTVFSVNTIGIGRNAKHWVKDGQSCDAVDMMDVNFDFWIDKNGAFKQNKAFTGFSLGRRECVGKQVAIKNIYVTLAALMMRYRFSVKDHQNWKIPTEDHGLYAPGKVAMNVTKRSEECVMIPISQSHLTVSNAGYDKVNGMYRWFIHNSKWCMFRQNESFSIESGVDVEIVYAQLNKLQAKNKDFRWSEEVEKCWIISNMDKSAFYYAAAQLNEGFVPNDTKQWISIHGSLPAPNIDPDFSESLCLDGNGIGDLSRPTVSMHSQSSNSSLEPLDEKDDDDDDGFLSDLSRSAKDAELA